MVNTFQKKVLYERTRTEKNEFNNLNVFKRIIISIINQNSLNNNDRESFLHDVNFINTERILAHLISYLKFRMQFNIVDVLFTTLRNDGTI